MTGLERRAEMKCCPFVREKSGRNLRSQSSGDRAGYCFDPGSRVSCDFNKQRLRIGTAGSRSESVQGESHG